MGEGAFGSNGSVHWQVKHTIDQNPDHGAYVQGRDPNIPCGGSNDQSFPERFVVTLRFQGTKELEAALKDMAENGRRNPTELVIKVPTFKPRRGARPVKPGEWEVSVAWEPGGARR